MKRKIREAGGRTTTHTKKRTAKPKRMKACDKKQLKIHQELMSEAGVLNEHQPPIAIWVSSLKVLTLDEVLHDAAIHAPGLIYAMFPGITSLQRRHLRKFCKKRTFPSDFQDEELQVWTRQND